MTSIWKQELETKDVQSILLPKDAQILTVQTQNEVPCLWFQFDLKNKDSLVERKITIHGTGHIIGDILEGMRRDYIGTYQLRGGALIFHVFELRKGV